MLFLLLLEQTVIFPLGASATFWQTHHWTWMVLAVEKGVPTGFIIGIASTILLSWKTFRGELRSFTKESGPGRFKWLLTHVTVIAALLGWTALCPGDGIFPSPYWEIWIWVRVALELLVLATWAAAALPPSLWMHWFVSSRRAFAIGAACAVITKLLAHYTEALWVLGLFQNSTLLTVAVLLRWCGQVVITGPAKTQIGTPASSVEVAAGCAGLQGFGVMAAFLALYFWAYRRDLRFPQVLLLVPFGLALQWFLNAVRITILILLGSWNQPAAMAGFHSVGGWLFVSLVAYALVIISWRFSVFTRIESPANDIRSVNPAGLYLVPILLIIATAIITRIFYSGFDLLYPARVVAAAVGLYFSRARAGVTKECLVVARYIGSARVRAVDRDVTERLLHQCDFCRGHRQAIDNWKDQLAFLRIVGAVVTVPIAEELAFRGYLMRKLIANDFEDVPPDRFTWVSFLVSSVLFGVLHGQWLAGTLAGMVFAAAVYRRGLLADAIVSHAVTNALLSVYVLTTHNWSLWT